MKMVRVKQVWYDEDPEFKGINSGLVLELEDGRLMRHSQDGFVIPFQEKKKEERPDGSAISPQV